MKYVLFTVFEDSQATQSLLADLFKKGYNGTMMGASSVNHTFSEKKNAPMFSLSNYAEGVKDPNLAVFFIIEEERLKPLQEAIREQTSSFTKIHGAMMVFPLQQYEGSF